MGAHYTFIFHILCRTEQNEGDPRVELICVYDNTGRHKQIRTCIRERFEP
jgi:hypothetical protein